MVLRLLDMGWEVDCTQQHCALESLAYYMATAPIYCKMRMVRFLKRILYLQGWITREWVQSMHG